MRLPLAALALLLLACAGHQEGTNPTAPDARRPDDVAAAELTVAVRRSPDAEPRHATLTCGERPSASGFITDAPLACRAVAERRALLVGPPPADRVCTMIYGGAQLATVGGRLAGAAVERTFQRRNGCEIADWQALEPLLGRPED